jgi:hypothetical protein
MRITSIFSALLFFTLLFTMSCTKDEEWKTVNITGSYTNTPDPAGGFYSVTLPNDAIMQVPKKYKVGGSDNLLGTVDETKSTLDVKSVVINPLTGAFDLTFTIAIFDKDGDEVDYKGTGQSYANGTGLSWQNFTGGTGKFDGITGWLNTSIATNPATGVHSINVIEGQATYKE